MIHQELIFFQIGDFGLAEAFTPAQNADLTAAGRAAKELLQTRGTSQWYTPEQFHSDWECIDWFNSTIAANFDARHTNVFGIGQVMYSIVTLDGNSPDSTQPFTPGHTIDGAPPRGATFGHHLHAFAAQYSQTLTDLIYQCLYENPAHRPTLDVLKTKITEAYNLALEEGAVIEPLPNFVEPPALGPRMQGRKGNAAGNFHPPGTVSMRCQAASANGAQCNRTVRLPVGTPYPVCKQCKRLGRRAIGI